MKAMINREIKIALLFHSQIKLAYMIEISEPIKV